MVAVVVLSWNGREDTLACLRSLASLEAPEPLVIVVDNGSSDGTPDAVREAFPGVELIETGVNLGFAGGNNAGIARALELGADSVLVLNNDVEVDPGSLNALLDEAARRPDAGAPVRHDPLRRPTRPDLVRRRGDPRSGYGCRQRGYREPDDARFAEVVETGHLRLRCSSLGPMSSRSAQPRSSSSWRTPTGRCARAAGFKLYVVRRTGAAQGRPGLQAAARRRPCTTRATRSSSSSATRRSRGFARAAAGPSSWAPISRRRSSRAASAKGSPRCSRVGATPFRAASARAPRMALLPHSRRNRSSRTRSTGRSGRPRPRCACGRTRRRRSRSSCTTRSTTFPTTRRRFRCGSSTSSSAASVSSAAVTSTSTPSSTCTIGKPLLKVMR